MNTDASFHEQIADAYEHLYDIAALRSHPLVGLMPAKLESKARAWRLHGVLLKAIDDIAPGASAPPHSKEWRRHRLMTLRYVEGLAVQNTAAELSISRRQFYRVHEEAIAAIADVIALTSSGATEAVVPDRLDLLRSEAARVTSGSHVSPSDIVRKVAEVLRPVCEQRGVTLRIDDLASVQAFACDAALLRQLLLALLDYLIERSLRTEIGIARIAGAQAGLSLMVATSIVDAHPERLAALNDMAQICNIALSPVRDSAGLCGFELRALTAPMSRVVLVLDDNTDMLELYERYLSPHGFTVYLASTLDAALKHIAHAVPDAVFLDVMMPNLDGWDVLQLLSHQPDTQEIPIVICSVLQQQELALSLGAAAFVGKPFSPETLLAALRQLM